jgi:hypothetical protein
MLIAPLISFVIRVQITLVLISLLNMSLRNLFDVGMFCFGSSIVIFLNYAHLITDFRTIVTVLLLFVYSTYIFCNLLGTRLRKSYFYATRDWLSLLVECGTDFSLMLETWIILLLTIIPE